MTIKKKNFRIDIKKTVLGMAAVLAASALIPDSVLAGEKNNVSNGVQQELKAGCMGHASKRIAQMEEKYHLTIVTYADKYNINPNLIKAVVSVESCYDSNAVSSAGAQGLMQLMPETAKWLGVSNSLDSDQNLEAGIRYLSKLRKRYNNNNTLALAAYNAGPGNVRKYNGVPPFPETQSYIVKVEERFKQYQMLNQLVLNSL